MDKNEIICLFVDPVNNYSVMSGQSQRFLGIYKQYYDELSVLLKDTTQCHVWGSNPEPLDSELLYHQATTLPMGSLTFLRTLI